MKELKHRITMRLSETQEEQLRLISRTLGLNPSATLRYLIDVASQKIK